MIGHESLSRRVSEARSGGSEHRFRTLLGLLVSLTALHLLAGSTVWFAVISNAVGLGLFVAFLVEVRRRTSVFAIGLALAVGSVASAWGPLGSYPACRGTPAVITTTSEPVVAS
jgi:hypothetical protein